MYNNFDIVKFNKEMNGGDLGALEYIKKTILDNMEEDLFNMNRVDYLKSLYSSVIALNTCVVATEQCGNATERHDTFDKYAEMRDMLFDELGIKYDYDYNEYYIENEEDEDADYDDDEYLDEEEDYEEEEYKETLKGVGVRDVENGLEIMIMGVESGLLAKYEINMNIKGYTEEELFNACYNISNKINSKYYEVEELTKEHIVEIIREELIK
jgi:hypothetical protein